MSEADVLGLLDYLSQQASFDQALRIFLVEGGRFDALFDPLFDEVTQHQSWILEQASTLLRKALGDKVPDEEEDEEE